VVVVLIALGVVGVLISKARTSARKSANSAIKKSLDISTSHDVDEVRTAIAQGLMSVGLRQTGSFDYVQFFRVNSTLQLELKVWPEDGQTRAHLGVPSVRENAGRPVKLAPASNAMAAAERAVRHLDPQAHIA
jgi:hypothetical protein